MKTIEEIRREKRKKAAEFNAQMHHTLCFMKRNTTLESYCQFCGKPGKLRYIFGEEFKIQIICDEHKSKYRDNPGFLDEIPVLNLLDYLKPGTRAYNKYSVITKEDLAIVDFLLNTDIPKTTALKSLGISEIKLNRIIEEYRKKDNKIEEKLHEAFDKNRRQKIAKVMIETRCEDTKTNRLASIKKMRNLSNRDIETLSNKQVLQCTISNIANDKEIPKIKTKCVLAEVLGVSVSDIFPNDTLYKEVYRYDDLLKLQSSLRVKLVNYKRDETLKGNKNIFGKIEEELGFRHGRLYEFTSGAILYYDDYEKLFNYFL